MYGEPETLERMNAFAKAKAEGLTHAEVGARFGVGAERAGQIIRKHKWMVKREKG